MFFLKRNKQRQSFICLKNREVNNFLAILQLCAFHIEYKSAKFTEINFRGPANVKYFMRTQLSQYFEDTAKVSSLPLLKTNAKSTFQFLPAKKKILILWIKLQTNQTQKVSKSYI